MKKVSAILVVIVSVLVLELFNSFKPKHPYSGLNITELVPLYGYSIENHDVVTEDNYILTLHRISGKNPSKKGPVLLMHGCAHSGTDFVTLGPGRALGLLLVDHGYDVWLGNVRGTTWSRRHKVLDANKDLEFWNFRMDEIGYYDVPAFIDYVLNFTKQESLHYVGYSQGTAVFFIFGSTRPHFLPKIKLMTALAPALFLKDVVGLFLQKLVHSFRLQNVFFEFFNYGELFSHDGKVSTILKHICNEHSLFVDICLHLNFLISGYNYDGLNKSELSLIYSNRPAGFSYKQMMQVGQWMVSGEFFKYDFGEEENLKKYKQKTAPHYEVSRISIPIAIYYSSNDRTVNPQNIERVVQVLPNVTKCYKVPLPSFGHNDFIDARSVVELVYLEAIEEMLKYN